MTGLATFQASCWPSLLKKFAPFIIVILLLFFFFPPFKKAFSKCEEHFELRSSVHWHCMSHLLCEVHVEQNSPGVFLDNSFIQKYHQSEQRLTWITSHSSSHCSYHLQSELNPGSFHVFFSFLGYHWTS